MPTLSNDFLCHKVLAALNAKTNNQAYYIGEGDLADWYVPVNKLLQITKTDDDHLKEVLSMMKEGDEIGMITKDGREHFYLKIKGIVAIEDKKYKKTYNIINQFKKAFSMW